MSAVKNVIKNNFRNMELNEFLGEALKDAGYGGIEVQKTPVGARIQGLDLPLAEKVLASRTS
jgi:small subunit ribosomal protein S3